MGDDVPPRKEWIEDIVISQVMRFIMDDEAIDELVDILMTAQKRENTTLPLLKQELREVEKSIKNMLDAIQNGIFTSSTKQRLEELEARKEDLEISIAQEQMFKPLLEPKKIKFFLHQFRKLDTTKLEHRKILVDSFLNGLVLYDDRIDFYFNYKDGTQTITSLSDFAAASFKSFISCSPSSGFKFIFQFPAIIIFLLISFLLII